MKKQLTILLAVILVLSLFAGCAAQTQQSQQPTAAPQQTAAQTTAEPTPEPEPEPEPITLYVSAAASLTDVMAEIVEQYKAVAPNVEIVCTFDSSGTLQTQIEEGAPADIFVSAALKQMNALNDEGLMDSSSIKQLLENKVVLIVPKDSTIALSSFEDVATDIVKMVAIGDPASVPVGQYTEEIYTYLNLWDEVNAKANYGENVRAVLAWIESGDADCGIVYATDAASTDGVKVICGAPEGSHKPVIYPAGVVKASENPEAAQAFLDYLSSADAVAAFEAAGFAMYQE